MLNEFLSENKKEILEMTESKTLELAGEHPSSEQLKNGLPIFYDQIIEVISDAGSPSNPPKKDIEAIAKAADDGDEPAMAEAAGQPQEAKLAETAGRHGKELFRLGYTLSHVVHAYGAMCQSITEIASQKDVMISSKDFHTLNRCLDVAIAGAVTEFEAMRTFEGKNSIHELKNALESAKVAFDTIKNGTVGVGGSTGQVLERSLKRIGELIDQT